MRYKSSTDDQKVSHSNHILSAASGAEISFSDDMTVSGEIDGSHGHFHLREFLGAQDPRQRQGVG